MPDRAAPEALVTLELLLDQERSASALERALEADHANPQGCL